ncbi:DinB family protein [Psychroserpens sp. XS_ASV72]|uniref:DinB family protein n=1 Tax=Psychroserpens sp. XS_ASV72 TaxID=3241293 RepID=UPI003512F59C
MTTSKQLANRLRELFLNGTWIAGTNYKLLLSGVDFKQASYQVETLNTIAKLTFHINYYLEGILQVFNGGPLSIKDQYSFDSPQIESENEWVQMRQNLFSNAELFANHVEKLTEAQLNSTFVDEKYGTYARNIEGLIEHSYYHFGQIALIKKLTNTIT